MIKNKKNSNYGSLWLDEQMIQISLQWCNIWEQTSLWYSKHVKHSQLEYFTNCELCYSLQGWDTEIKYL